MKALAVLLFCSAVMMALVIGAPRQLAAQPAVVEQADEARQAEGTWKTNDGNASGRWRARYSVEGTTFTGIAAFEGTGNTGPAALQGQVDGDHITFSTTSAASADSTDADVTWQFDGVIRGAKVKGTLVDGSGRAGKWDGWWTVSEHERKAREKINAASDTVSAAQ